MKKTALILDFDSTIVCHEALDILAEVALADDPHRDERAAAIRRITNKGMLGVIGFKESLARRFEKLQPSHQHVEQVVSILRSGLSPSFVANKAIIKEHSGSIYVVSGGFADLILPVLEPFNLGADHVVANNFIWNSGRVMSYDKANPLASDDGKIRAVRLLGLNREEYRVIMVGDGMTDYAVRKAAQADEFVAFTETARRAPVIELADRAVASFDELFSYIGWL